MPDETTQPTAEGTVTVEVPASEVAAVQQVAPDATVAPAPAPEAPAATEATPVPEAPAPAVVPDEVAPEPTAPAVEEQPAPIASPVVGLRFTTAVDCLDRHFEPGDQYTYDELVAAGVDANTLTHIGALVAVHEEDVAALPGGSN